MLSSKFLQKLNFPPKELEVRRETEKGTETDSYLAHSGNSSDVSCRSFRDKSASFLNRTVFLVLPSVPHASLAPRPVIRVNLTL